MDTLVVGVSQWKTDIAERSRLNVINVPMLLFLSKSGSGI